MFIPKNTGEKIKTALYAVTIGSGGIVCLMLAFESIFFLVLFVLYLIIIYAGIQKFFDEKTKKQ